MNVEELVTIVAGEELSRSQARAAISRLQAAGYLGLNTKWNTEYDGFPSCICGKYEAVDRLSSGFIGIYLLEDGDDAVMEYRATSREDAVRWMRENQ